MSSSPPGQKRKEREEEVDQTATPIETGVPATTTENNESPSATDKKKKKAEKKARKAEQKAANAAAMPPVGPVRSHYFMVEDIVWVHPKGLPYWPAEVTAVNDKSKIIECKLFSPPLRGIPDCQTTISAPAPHIFFFDRIRDDDEFNEVIEKRLKRNTHNVEPYEQDFKDAVRLANRLVRAVQDPNLHHPFNITAVGTVKSFFRSHTAAPRQPGTERVEAQTACIVMKRGMENALRDLKGFEYVWVVFHFNFSTGIHPGRPGSEKSPGWKAMLVPPRDTVPRGVFATRSPHRPNPIGLSCCKLVDVKGLEVHLDDHDLLHGTPILDIKPYIPFCDAHPDARHGWVQKLDEAGKGGEDHRIAKKEYDGKAPKKVYNIFRKNEDEEPEEGVVTGAAEAQKEGEEQKEAVKQSEGED